MGLLNLFRIVCYVVLVGPQSALVQIPADLDMFLSGSLRLVRWGWLLQDYTTLSTSQNMTPSTVALISTVRNHPRHRCSCQYSDIG